MGLDAVEIILRTEDEFSIAVGDDEAAVVRTVGDLYNLVLSKLDITPGCLTSKAFYITRRALVNCLQIPRRSIRPATPLGPLLPDETRRTQWQQICKQIGLATPPLRIPGAVKQHLYISTFFVSSAIAAALCIAGLWRGWWAASVIVLSVVLWVALSVASTSVAERMSSPRLATELPADTAGELARVVLSMNYEHFAPPEAPTKPTNEDVWRRLVDIICDQLQVDGAEVVPNARFVDDLGVD
jgi:acyl carrier protein